MTKVIYRLPISETLSNAWQQVKGMKASIWVAMILFLLIFVCLAILQQIIDSLYPSIEGIPDLIVELITTVLQAGILYIGIQRIFDRPFSYKLMFQVLKPGLGLKILGSYLLQAIILVAIFFLLLIPVGFMTSYPNNTMSMIGSLIFVIDIIVLVYLSLRMYFAIAFVLDRNAWPWESIKFSFQLTRSNTLEILIILVMAFVIILLSAIPLGIGLIWTIPWYYALYGLMYKNLLANFDSKKNNPITKNMSALI